MKTVLYVSGDTALWVGFKRGVVVDCFSESISNPVPIARAGCRWFKGKYIAVHLLIDNEQTEIDAHPLLHSGSGWAYRSNKRALHRRLIERFPDAIVRTATKKSKLDAAFVHHINLPESTRLWLSAVETGAITFCSITTVGELLADRFGVSSDASIIVSVGADFIRHTYCCSGYALFTRAVTKSNPVEHADQFKQTLNHLSVSSLIDSAVPVFAIGLSSTDAAFFTEHELVSEVVNVDSQVPRTEKDQHSKKRYQNEFFIAKHVFDSVKTRTNSKNRQASCVIDKHVSRRFRRRERSVFALLAVGVIISICYAVSSELQRTAKALQLRERHAELSEKIRQYQQKALQLSPDSVPLSQALLDRTALEASTGVSPAMLITVLSEAFTDYQDLELRELKWIVVDANDQAHDTEFDASAMAITSRLVMPSEGAVPSVTKIRLTGKIVNGESLREQHNAVNALTAHLAQQSNLTNLTVLQAPLMQVDGARQLVNGELSDSPEFQLQFDLVRSTHNDA